MAEEEQKEVRIVKEIHRPLFDMTKRSDGIVRIGTVEVAWFTLNEARETMEAFREITEGVPHLFLYVPGKKMAVDKDARSYYASPEGLEGVTAMAVVLRNMAQRITANLYTAVDKPVRPVKFFDTEQAALEWLNKEGRKIAPPATEHTFSKEDEEVTITRQVNFPLFSLQERSDGILVATTADELFLTLKDAKAFAGAVNKFTGKVPHLLLVIPGRHASIDKEFRSYMASKEALEYTSAAAFVLQNTSQRNIANMFLTVDKPVKPMRFFDTPEDALAWLKQLDNFPEIAQANVDVLPAITETGITIEKEVHRPLFSMYRRSDGIVVLVTVDHAHFTINDAQVFTDAQREITDGEPHLFLGIPGRHASIDNELRSFMATPEALKYSIAEAYILRNMTQRGIANLLLTVDKPVKPLKFFNNTEDAIRWLKTQKP